MNTKNQYLANPKVRQAIRYLVDYHGLVKTALREGWIINQTFLPNGVLGYVDCHPYKLDIAKAKALLAEGRYPQRLPAHGQCRFHRAVRAWTSPRACSRRWPRSASS